MRRVEIDSFQSVPDEDVFRYGISLALGENHDTNVSKIVRDAIIRELDLINLYPDMFQIKARERIAKYSGFARDAIILGNGIDDLLLLIAITYIAKGDEVIVMNPTFDGYEKVTGLMGGVVKRIDLDRKFHLSLSSVEQNVSDRTKIIFIANPNNPTGNILLTDKEVEQTLTKFKGLLVIDECYYGICNRSVVDLVGCNPRLLVLRSFSKSFALAGLRTGYAIGGKMVIGEMRKVAYNVCPFGVDRLAQASTIILEYPDEINRLIENFKRKKARFEKLLVEVPLKVLPTETSFVLLDLENSKKDGYLVRKDLMAKGILAKVTGCKEFDKRYIPMGVPRKSDIPRVISTLKRILENNR